MCVFGKFWCTTVTKYGWWGVLMMIMWRFRHFLMLLQVFSHLYCILQVLYRKQQSQKAATALSRPKTAPRFWWSLALHTPLKSTSFIALERAWKMLHFTPRKCVGTWSVLWNMAIQRFWWVRGPNLACMLYGSAESKRSKPRNSPYIAYVIPSLKMNPCWLS